MKKILSILMMGLMLISMVSVAFAVGNNASENTGNNEVTTQNQGNTTQVQTQNRVQLRDGTHMMEGGKQLQVREHMGEMQLQSGNMVANTNMMLNQEMIGNKTRMNARLSNGNNFEIKIMPDKASENALNALRLRNCREEDGCTIELKEVGKGNETKAAYELKTQRKSRLFGIFGKNMEVGADVDAETGEVLNTHKPWWAFLASEPSETQE